MARIDKVSFDGVNKVIYVNSDVTTLDIRTDVYSAWIDWLVVFDNIKYEPMIRVTGFDPIGGGVYTGDVYFLINGWKLSIDLQKVKVNGVLYSDNYDTAFYTSDLLPIYPVTVSALVTTIASGASGTGPTASQIRQEIDNNSIKLNQIKSILDSMTIPTASDNAVAVWGKPVSDFVDKTTIGGFISKMLLTVPKFLGLK